MHRTALALTGLAVVALGGTGVAVASAATSPTPAPAASAASTASTGKPHRAAALHSEAVRGGARRTVTIGTQRGTLTAVSTTSLTVRSVDGFERTYVLGPQAKVKIDGKDGAGSDLRTGEKVGVAAVRSGDSWTLRRARARS